MSFSGVSLINPGVVISEIIFSPNSNYVVIPNGGIYSLPSGERYSDYRYGVLPAFSPNGALMASYEGIIDLATQDKVSEISGKTNRAFSPDGNFLVIARQGLYAITDGSMSFPVEGDNPIFNYDGSLLATSDGENCLIYGKLGETLAVSTSTQLTATPTENSFIWTARVRQTSGANIRDQASINGVLLAVAPAGSTVKVIARTSGNDWVKVDIEASGIKTSGQDKEGWVSSNLLENDIPPELPVDDSEMLLL